MLIMQLPVNKTRFHAIRLRLEHHVPGSRWRGRVWEFALFVFKQAWACLFGGSILALVVLTKYFWPDSLPLARYDFLFLAALAIQVALLLLRLETVGEAKMILVFHVVGTAMEVFKTAKGSWVYPGRAVLHVGHVPLFSGFMYASVGSFMARTTRIFAMRYTRYPRRWITAVLGLAIYANFFTHHYLPDARVLLLVAVGIVFGPTWVYYKPYRKYRRMPLLVGFALVALFIWLAENISTFARVWTYPHQQHGWHMVRWAKYDAWLLLMIVSFILVSFEHGPRPPEVDGLEDGGA